MTPFVGEVSRMLGQAIFHRPPGEGAVTGPLSQFVGSPTALTSAAIRRGGKAEDRARHFYRAGHQSGSDYRITPPVVVFSPNPSVEVMLEDSIDTSIIINPCDISCAAGVTIRGIDGCQERDRHRIGFWSVDNPAPSSANVTPLSRCTGKPAEVGKPAEAANVLRSQGHRLVEI